MEKHHKQRLQEKFPTETANKPIIVLDIPDDYQFMDPELVAMLKSTIAPYLNDVDK
ncbi:hypothetical protein GCM10028809_15760 [Spirosoma gilvum]